MEPNDGFKNKQDNIDETTTMPSNDKTVVSSTEMTKLVAQASADDDSDNPSQDKPKKKSHAMVIGMVFLAILAIGGIGFGIWAWTTGFAQNMKHEEEIMDLRSQLAEATRPVVEEYDIEDDEIEEDYEEKNEDVDTADYIYVGEWGLKIKIPDELKSVGYHFGDSDYGEWLAVAGLTDATGIEKAYQYTDADKFFAGTVLKSNSDDGFFPYGSLVYTDDEQNKYYYEGPQANMGSTEEETRIWSESVEIIKNMLTNPENYSKI